jgi:hypothetical protein
MARFPRPRHHWKDQRRQREARAEGQWPTFRDLIGATRARIGVFRGGFPFRHYAGRGQCGAWLLRSTQISLNEEA